jgi:molybdenum-dependent DNA-binding transcriptional regulator ModE
MQRGGRNEINFHFTDNGEQVARNYHQARKQKELARKARQQEKQQRRSARLSTTGESAQATPVEGAGAPAEPKSGGGS